jgi:hypothetical protein
MIKVSIDCEARTIEIHGIRYAMDLFEAMAFSPVGTWVRILSREDGLVTLQRPSPEIEAELNAKIDSEGNAS